MVSKETILALILSVLLVGSCKKDEIELPAAPATQTIDSTVIPTATQSQPKSPILSFAKGGRNFTYRKCIITYYPSKDSLVDTVKFSITGFNAPNNYTLDLSSSPFYGNIYLDSTSFSVNKKSNVLLEANANVGDRKKDYKVMSIDTTLMYKGQPQKCHWVQFNDADDLITNYFISSDKGVVKYTHDVFITTTEYKYDLIETNFD
tara:strand:- start:20830 stop:21444 length:615 start_codon:yes stop_codon:yes gene_type:complete